MNSTSNSVNEKPEENTKAGEENVTEAAVAIKEMKAVVLTAHGGLKGLRVMNKPEPTPGDGEVVIRVKAW